MSRKFYWRLTNIALVNDEIHERINKGREDSHVNTLSLIYDCEPPSKHYMPKLLTLDKEDNVMIYVCSYSHRSYSVIDPLTCSACPPSLLAKNSALNRDGTCASKTLKPNLVLRVHYTYLWIEQDPSSKLSSVQ